MTCSPGHILRCLGWKNDMGLWLESQILRWQHPGTQQLDWEQPQDPQPALPQLEQEQAGTQQQTGTQQLEPQPPQLEPQPPEQPEQPMVLMG